MAKKSFLQNLIKGDQLASIAADGVSAAEYSGCLDTGSYILNAVLSGSLYGGVPNNKVTAFAGQSGVGKSFFCLAVVKTFLEQHEEGVVIYYDTEAAITNKMMEERGIDTSRVVIAEPSTIQEFREHAVEKINQYMEVPEDERPPMLIVLDSLGMLSSNKEVTDITEKKDTRDMTKQQLIRGTFRVITLKLAKAKIPLILSNHTYQAVGQYVPTDVISGGGGVVYAASTIATLTRKKDRDDATKEVLGNIITVTMFKSRLSRENKKVEVKLNYDTGLDRYYGLLPLAEKYGIAKKISKKYEINGISAFEKAIYKNPTKYFTEEVMKQLEEAASKEFKYGRDGDEENHIEETEEEENNE